MHVNKTLITIALCTALAACGSSSKKTKPVPQPDINKPSIELMLPDDGSALVEDYPLANYITYPSNETTIDTITSIDVNWPSLNVFQSGKEYGYVDATTEEQFYFSIAHKSNDALAAVDAEQQVQRIWYVNADNTLNLFDLDAEQTSSWTVIENAEFTELAIDEEGQENIWLYDKAAHRLVHFDAAHENATEILLTGELNIEGLAIVEDNLLLLANNDTEHFVMHYEIDGTELSHQKSWLLEGFGNTFFNDVNLLPQGDIAVSTDATDNNLYLVADRDELLGAGPLPDTAELALIEQVELDPAIKQPSGIWSLDDGSWMLITDQAEMIKLDESFNITETVDIEFDSINCNQGCTEAIIGGTNEFYALADNGLIGHFAKTDNAYSLVQEFKITVNDDTGSPYGYSGMARNNATGEFYLIPDQKGEDQEDKLITLNSDFSVKSVQTITVAEEIEESIYTYDAQGVHYSQGHVFVLSEKYTKVLQLTLDGEIVEVIDLSEEDVRLPSDLAIKDGLFYIIGDHENHEAVPPISIFEIDDD